jgi:hypothetical protein
MSMNLVVKGKFLDITDIDRITKSPQGKARINDKDEVCYATYLVTTQTNYKVLPLYC